MGRLGGGRSRGRHGYRRLGLPPGNVRGLHQTGPAVEHRGAGAAAHQAIADPHWSGTTLKAVPQCGQRVVKAMALRGSYAFRPCGRAGRPSRRARQTDMAIHGA